MEMLERGRSALRSVNVSPSEAATHGLPVSQDGQRRDGFQLLAFPDIGIDDLRSLCPGLDDVSPDALEQLEIEALYATYVERQERDAQSLARDEAQAIPDTLDYDDLTGLSAELRGKLEPHSSPHAGAGRPDRRNDTCGAGAYPDVDPAGSTEIRVTEAEAKRRIAESVSRETLIRLEIYEQVLRKWQPKLNLVSNGTLDSELWTRHFLDSFQVFEQRRNPATCGSTSGRAAVSPAWSCAICAATRAKAARVSSWWKATRGNARFFGRSRGKQAFPSSSEHARIEALPPAGADIVSARALAPLPRLLEWAHRHMRPDGLCLLQKGANHALELETARADWQMDVDVQPSMTAPDSVILRIRNLSHA
jgi:16S rRNA (guanine527-N7)-methyltransferase